MTTLRQKMIEEMHLHSFAERTQDSYLRAVRQLVEYYNKPPDQINEKELRQYFLYLKNGKKVSRSTITLALCGIKFFYERTLQRQWATLALVRLPREKKLPVVQSVDEVRQILARVWWWRYGVCLGTIYACGLLLQEGLNLQIGHFDGGRQLLLVCHGKGGKDRYVPLPQPVLEILRQYWATHRDPIWIFSLSHQTVKGQMNACGVQQAFQGALLDSDIQKHASVHTLRHYYATHLLESGLNLCLIHSYLGHASPSTTAIYTHLTKPSEDLALQVVNRVVAGLWNKNWPISPVKNTGSPIRPCLSPEYADQLLPSHHQAMRAIGSGENLIALFA
jgi:integrase/recombinase XerD